MTDSSHAARGVEVASAALVHYLDGDHEAARHDLNGSPPEALAYAAAYLLDVVAEVAERLDRKHPERGRAWVRNAAEASTAEDAVIAAVAEIVEGEARNG